MQLRPHPSAALLLCLVAFAAAVAKPLPHLRFHDLAGHSQDLAALRGTIAVVNFWATWCGPCREELPRLSALSADYATRGVRFIAISADDPEDRPKIEPFLRQQKIGLDVWLDADLGTLDRLQLGNVLPATLIADKDGQIVGRISGEARNADLRRYLDWLLSNRPGPAPPPLLRRY